MLSQDFTLFSWENDMFSQDFTSVSWENFIQSWDLFFDFQVEEGHCKYTASHKSGMKLSFVPEIKYFIPPFSSRRP
ncbi:hypothetical protein A4H97_11625 [Niastella yeongjuensis]|uniref:Uncharacterized protein n=1 Tax=Niastella yeongjuensis TaxID=354355 RepID=A0A1V9E9K2_9BACT|nr:hypothetical protein A4H97_11625 [Niastella yeongjuensis]